MRLLASRWTSAIAGISAEQLDTDLINHLLDAARFKASKDVVDHRANHAVIAPALKAADGSE